MYETSELKRLIHVNNLTFLKNSRIFAWKITLFLDFANSRIALKKSPILAKIDASMDVRFGREGVGRETMKILCRNYE